MKWISVLLLCGSAAAQTEWSGMLLDASCLDRNLRNLLSPPTQEIAVPAKQEVAKVPGITVAPRVIRREQAETLLTHTPDHASRYHSASCALTADTKAFALLLLPDGPLLDLNEAGNTLAMESFQATSIGREILNGKTGGWKPHAVVKGLRQGDEIKAASVSIAAGGK